MDCENCFLAIMQRSTILPDAVGKANTKHVACQFTHMAE